MESIKTSDFRRLNKYGIKTNPACWMLICAIKAEKPKLGITISKTVANAVLRNKLKRWVKESLGKSKSIPNAEMNIVFKKSKKYRELKHDELRAVIQKGLAQILKKL